MEKTLGDRMKRYELEEAGRRMLPRLPILARLDGRAFHTFTRGLRRPFDEDFCRCMALTTAKLVDKFHASLGYTQSDEITLFWLNNDPQREMMFDGRYQKWTSLLAAAATRQFCNAIDIHLSAKSHLDPEFDCRVWQVPDMTEAYHAFLWREDDATRNSLQMASQAIYTRKELFKKGRAELHEMLFQKGINWNDYPPFFKRGTYVRRMPYEHTLTAAELARIPAAHRPTEPVVRTAVFPLAAPPLFQLKALGPLLDGTVPAQQKVFSLYHPEDYR